MQGNDLVLSIFKKSQKRNKKASGSEQTVRLVLTIRWAIVVVVLARIIHETGNHRQFARRKVEWSVIVRMSDM